MMDLKIENTLPKKRFSSFKKNWNVKLYGDIYNFYSTNSLSRDKLNYESGKVFNIHYGDIHTKFSSLFDLTKELVPLINNDVDLSKYNEEKYCREGDLVVADASEDYEDIGKTIELININNKKVLAGLHTFLARPNKYKMAKGFATYLMQTWKVRKQVMVIAQGTKVLGIATGRLGKVKLSIPEYQEQKKITSFLNSVDDKLKQLTKKKELLNEYKKGVMQKIFSQELRFKDDNGNKYPDWEEKKLGEVLERTSTGLNPRRNFKLGFGNNYYITIKNIDNGKLNFDKAEKIDDDAMKMISKRSNLTKNDIIMSSIGNVGESYLLKEEPINWNINESVFMLRAKSIIKPYFLYFILNNADSKWYLKSNSTGSSFKSIKLKDLKLLPLRLPSLDEQQKISNFLSAIDKKIDLVNTQIENTKAFKKGLLQQMFV